MNADNKVSKIITKGMVFEYLEEKILDNTYFNKEYDLYIDYKNYGRSAIMKTNVNFRTYLRLREEMMKIYNGEEV